ncbi:hypothetical protein [Natronobeatus ordinarius]|uniref:hypothetical protein n=1 Tax=Natronobeatus ordinarius TaxID=2963433 RepID=UPI0020CBC2C8|nr:hypothetical protein [Natronobeatus ordinarius]
MRPPLAAFVLVSVVIGAGIVGLAVAAPPPTVICAVCDGDLEGATGPGTLDVYLEESGDAEWVERVPVDATAADRYRDDPEALEAAVEEAWAPFSHVTGEEVTDVEGDLEGDDVVVTYAVADVARPGVGDTWLVDYFYAGGTATRYHVGGERVTIHPPDGHVVTNRPPDGHLADGAVAWDGGDPGPLASDFDSKTVVTYGPDDDVATTAASYATIAAAIGPLAVRHGVLAGVIPALVVSGGALAATRLERSAGKLRRLHARVCGRDVDELGRRIVLVGIAGVLVAPLVGYALAGQPITLDSVALAAGAAGYAVLGAIVRQLEGDVRTGSLLAVAVAVALGSGTVSWLVLSPAGAVVVASFVLSAAAFLPFGHAMARGRGAALAFGPVVAGPFAAAVAIAPVYVFGLSPLVYGLFLAPTAVLVVAAGYPLSVVGRALAVENEAGMTG